MTVTSRIARLTAEAAGVKGCTLRLLNQKEGRLELIASHGLSDRYLQKGPIDVDRSLTESLKGFPVRIRDVTTDASTFRPWAWIRIRKIREGSA